MALRPVITLERIKNPTLQYDLEGNVSCPSDSSWFPDWCSSVLYEDDVNPTKSVPFKDSDDSQWEKSLMERMRNDAKNGLGNEQYDDSFFYAK
jgi:hypothetical protein